jgi:uncharacterized protein
MQINVLLAHIEAQAVAQVYKAVCAAIILVSFLTASVAANPLENAVSAVKEGDYATALQLLRPLADSGDARAQFNLGYLYANGWGVPQDYTEAVSWYRKAADQGLPAAQHYLGIAYANGDGVPQDDAEAARWYRLAAEQGYAAAQLNLGAAYADGRGVPRDPFAAYVWINLSAYKAMPLPYIPYLD